ncbi:hypothetical protein IQ272_06625 [Chroococcidiopsidales cyanobacterium LEGE 13417]|uniref:hypothetical protein n=1 Tax=Chroococcidiopsis sp. CCALA 051 TaxID=869949 RepID=UPI0011B1E941|nr:hypothetical protein [Chroococcidiopsis sp. CCALA 051]MBE9015817.1 hypothetical protein [Chroococcidiopsidales cyanobacterium LEGE 13417]
MTKQSKYLQSEAVYPYQREGRMEEKKGQMTLVRTRTSCLPHSREYQEIHQPLRLLSIARTQVYGEIERCFSTIAYLIHASTDGKRFT